MAKTKLTKDFERSIRLATSKMGTFGCFEVTIGFGGNERVDYMTYDTKGFFRCYEIKVSKPDFYSGAKKTFCGDYNYFVMPKELYEQVKQDIPPHVGVYGEWGELLKRPKKVECSVDKFVLMTSLMRSLYRDAQKYQWSENENVVDRLKREAEQARREADRYRDKYQELKYGVNQ
jgi:hypothetical protein